MKVEICEEFYYRIRNENINLEKEFNSCGENILRNNEKIKLYAGEWVKIKINNFVTHFVLPVETLESISKKYNVSIDKLFTDNNLTDKKLYIGQMLRIYN